MNLLNKLTRKNLKLNKKRSIVTIIGIILSVALITAVSSMYASAIGSLIQFEKKEKGNFHAAFYDVPINEVQDIKNNTKVSNVAIVQNIGYAILKDSKNEDKPYAYLKAYDDFALKNLSVNLVKGKLPSNDHEIVIPTSLKTNGRIELEVGDTITLDVGSRVIGNTILNQQNPFTPGKETIQRTTQETYTIVGISERPADNVEPYTAPGYTFITYKNHIDDDIKSLDVYALYNKKGAKNSFEVTAGILEIEKNTLTKLNNSDFTSQEELDKLLNELDKAKYQYTTNDYLIMLENNPLSDGPVAGLGVVVVIVCAIIIVTSVYCIKNSFDISITEKIKQYGMLKSIGATKKQIKKNVFYETTILGLIGIPLGILFGLLASYILIIISNYFLTDLSGLNGDIRLVLTISWLPIAISILLGIITIYLSALRSARKAAKVSPIESIRNSGDIKIKNNKLVCPRIITKLFGEGGKISYKNVKRNNKKYRTTVISVIVSVSIFIALSSFMTLAFTTVETEFGYADYDLDLSLYGNNHEYNYQLAKDTTKLDNIDDYSIIRYRNTYIKNPKYNQEYINYIKETYPEYDIYNSSTLNGSIFIASISDYQYNKYIKSLGLNINNLKDSGIIINNVVGSIIKDKKTIKKNYHYFDYQNNEVISITTEEDDGTIKTNNLKIVYSTDKVPFGLENLSSEHPLIIVSDKQYDELTSVINNGTNVVYKTDNPTKLQDEIEVLVENADYYLNNKSENVKMMRNFYTLIAIFLYGFITVISLIGITNIFNTITTSMELRKREFATLKSVGMTKREFNNMISLESIFIGTKALFIGIPIGICLSYLIYISLADGSPIKYQFPYLAIIISILVVFLLISLIMQYSLKKINQQNTIETIRNENI